MSAKDHSLSSLRIPKKLIVAGILSMLLLLVIVLWHGATVKRVTLVVNGEEMEISTKRTQVSELLEEHGVEIGPHDDISMNSEDFVEDGDEVTIEHAQHVTLILGGVETTLPTTASTVKEALDDWGVELGEEDEVFPELHARLEREEIKPHTVRVIRVHRTYEDTLEEIPYQTVNRNNPELLKGKSQIIQEGEPGLKVRKIEKVWRDSSLIEERVVDEWIELEAQEHVVAVGTREPVVTLSANDTSTAQTVTKDGLNFEARQVLENVTLTAYDAGVQSTGKSKDHPQYGVTYTGSTVQEGRTVAVDPKVIPLNWWMYIEGIGFRKAEDIGSAVKGKKIDVYMDSKNQALKFGVKKGHTVYVIGPEKPSGV